MTTECETLQSALDGVQSTIPTLTANRDAADAVSAASQAAASAAFIVAGQDAQAAAAAQAELDSALASIMNYTSQLQMLNCPGYGA